jgi:signal transduction histidine kinase
MGQAKRIAQNHSCSALLDEVDQSLSRALAYTRTLVTDLSPAVLREEGLAAGLKWLGQYMKKYDLAVTVTVPEDLTLPEDRTVLLFQSVRELLINSWKHAGTGEASVTVERGMNVLRIQVQDKGKGFAVANTPGEISSKFGLFSIRERMAALGGAFEIVSVPGFETTCVLTVPL